MRSTASVSVKFGLLSIPAKVFKAAKEEKIGFKWTHAACKAKVGINKVCIKCNRALSMEEISSGFETADGLVVFTPEELKATSVQPDKQISIEGFVPAEAISNLITNETYYVGCDPKVYERSFWLLQEAMRLENKVGICYFVNKGIDHLGIISAGQNGVFTLKTVYHAEEVNPVSEVPMRGSEKDVSQDELQLARNLITSMAIKFELEEFPNKRIGLVKQAMTDKGIDLTRIKHPASKADAPNKNLLDALRLSLQQKVTV
jgi:DNA end-binding protein Ku